MNILVFSDSHGNNDSMISICKSVPHDIVLHCGDLVRDAEILASFTRVMSVSGNNDGYTKVPLERLLEFDGVKIWMLHGHTMNVKLSTVRLVGNAKQTGVELVLFGHTHIPLCREESGVTLCNPGSIGYSGSPTYATIVCRDGGFKCVIREVYGNF